MHKNYAVILYIAEKNCAKDQVDELILLLEKDYDFENRGSSYS